MKEALLESLEAAIRQEGIDGWLFCSFRGSDPISENILDLDDAAISTRRWFYFVPARGVPQRIVHTIEPHVLDTLPGDQRVYLSWQQLHDQLKQAIRGARSVAMQYSPMNSIPYVSRVDAGTVELVRQLGAEVVSSANLVQVFEATWTAEQLETHLFAARHLREIVDVTFGEAGRHIRDGSPMTEMDVQDVIWQEYERRGLLSSHRPIVAVNAHSADPHYAPDPERNAVIGKGDSLLIDIWAKRRAPHSVYYDTTWVAILDRAVPELYRNIFDVVRNARDAAIQLVTERMRAGTELLGCEVDNCARESIRSAGYGENFLHRTGHSIHEEVHGNGSNIDNLETLDSRRLVPHTCFSIEPGVYLPGQFGVRSEVDVYLEDEDAIVTGQPIQAHVVAALG